MCGQNLLPMTGWRVGTLLVLVFLLPLLLDAQSSNRWQNLRRKYSGAILVLVTSDNLNQGVSNGFFVSEKGHLVTILPESARQKSLLVRRADGSLLQARLIKSHPSLPFAVLQVVAARSTAVRLGDSNRVKVGDVVGILGYTTAGGLSVLTGTVSQIQRLGSGVKIMRISPSPHVFLPGAPVFDQQNRVIGVVARIGGIATEVLPIGYLQITPSASKPPASSASSGQSSEPSHPLWTKLQPIVQAVRQIPDLAARSKDLAAVGRVLKQVGLDSKAQVLFEEAITTLEKVSDIEEKSFALNQVALQLIEAHQWERALQLANQIPNPLQKATLMYELSRQAAKANQIVSALSVARQIENPFYRCRALVSVAIAQPRPTPPTDLSASTPSSSESEAEPSAGNNPALELLHEAQQIASQLPLGRQQIAASATVAVGMLVVGETESGEAMLKQAIEQAQQMGGMDTEASLYDIALILSESQQEEKAQPLLEQLPGGRRDEILLRLIETRIQSGQTEQIEPLINRIRDGRKLARAKLLYVEHLVRHQQHATARAIANSLPISLERIQAEAQLLVVEVSSQPESAEAPAIQPLVEMAQRLSDTRQRPESLAIVAAVCLRTRKIEEGQKLFQEALRAAQGLGEPWTSTLQAKILLMQAEALQSSWLASTSTHPATQSATGTAK
jgi:tetratricopeptide (TPR) repeat protein